MSREAHDRHFELVASPYAVAITTVLRRKYFFALDLIVITIRPSKVRTIGYFNELF